MILLYACESWCLTEKLLNLLRSFHARCVRAMCRVNRLHVRMHRITTAELLERLGLRTLDAYVHRRQLQWAGHVLRMPYERIPRKMMTCWVPERRPVGCPEFTYGRGLYKALKNAGVDKEDWSTLAEDRENWRRTISHLKQIFIIFYLYMCFQCRDPGSYEPGLCPMQGQVYVCMYVYVKSNFNSTNHISTKIIIK